LRTSSIQQTLFAYKAWANEELFNLLNTIDENLFPEIVHSAVRVLNHAYVVDEIFKSHLLQTPHHYTTTNTQETPTVQSLLTKVKKLDAWYISYVANIVEDSLKESINFLFTDGEGGQMTREEILLHLITHGGYHRGQAGQIIRSASASPPRDLLTRFLHLNEPSRRVKNA
jgi:uncharacterized damage-inducible protein DinB